jgi:hypothetical protein
VHKDAYETNQKVKGREQNSRAGDDSSKNTTSNDASMPPFTPPTAELAELG